MPPYHKTQTVTDIFPVIGGKILMHLLLSACAVWHIICCVVLNEMRNLLDITKSFIILVICEISRQDKSIKFYR